MSQYEDELAALEAKRCVTCKGSGELDDAELGDIFYNKWVCDHCDGTGMKREKKHECGTAQVNQTS